MAKRKPARRSAVTPKNARSRSARPPAKSKPATRASVGRAGKAAKRPKPPTKKKAPPKKAIKNAIKKAVKKPLKKAAAPTRRASAPPVAVKRPSLDRERRTLEETVQTPPSSLDMDRHATAARSGRAALRKSLKEHTGMTPELTAGDSDGDWENAYFSGEEAPGGDNPSPDQNVVDDIGRALGVEYQDGEELQASDKVGERDEHRWELDPASAEDYKDRK
ncbi:MAG: DUF6335 family protein [Acidobacteriota bacterium]